MTARRFLASAVDALVDATGKKFARALAPAVEGDPGAVAVLITFARVVRLIAGDAPDVEVHAELRALLVELAALREHRGAVA